MIVSSDNEYIELEEIKRGNKIMNPDFNELVNWIKKTYDVIKILNITSKQETTFHSNENFTKLNIYLEYENDKNKFDKYGGTGSDIIDKEIISIFKGTTDKKYYNDKIEVHYYDFEHIAKSKANGLIPKVEVEKLIESFSNKDFWTIHRCFELTTFFLHTEEQVRKYKNDNEFMKWTIKYFELLKKYDEFDYFKQVDFKVKIDSKEHFDNSYEGNWFYYDR